MWADDSDNDDNERPSFKTSKPKNYSAPIGFVAGGIQQAGKKKEKVKEENGSDEEGPTTSFKTRNSSSDEDEGRGRRGIQNFYFYIEAL